MAPDNGTMITPYPFQEAAIDATFGYYGSGKTGDVIIAMPTGTGKSIIPAAMITRAFHWWPNQRALLLTHVKELVKQNSEKLLTMWPMAPLGICSASLGTKHTVAPIIYGNVQTAISLAHEFGHRDVLFIDEAHLLSDDAGSMYQKLIRILRETNPAMRVIGLSATPWRTKQGTLVENGLFDEVVFDITGIEAFNRLIAEGYLCTLIPKPTQTAIDTAGVGTQHGEYNRAELETAADRVTYQALTETCDRAIDRKSWIVFASGVTHSEHCGQILERFGVSNVIVHSRMTNKERDRRIDAFKGGYVKAVISNNVLTTGFDHPPIDLIVGLRPTKSPGLHVQMLGRGTRPLYAEGIDRSTAQGRLEAMWAGGKHDCLVFDFARNVAELGPINNPIIPEKKKGKKGGGDMPVKICPKCDTYVATQTRVCDYCEYEFPFSVALRTTPGTHKIVEDNEAVVEFLEVSTVYYGLHRKHGSADMIKATYFTAFNQKIDEYICIEHPGIAGKTARDWWRQRWPDSQDPPTTTAEALRFVSYLKPPRFIRVQTNGKYPRILGVEF